MSESTPAGYFVGIIDFFAVLVPGTALLMLLTHQLAPSGPTPHVTATGSAEQSLAVAYVPQSSGEWVVLLVMGYIAGHLLSAGGYVVLLPAYHRYAKSHFDKGWHGELTQAVREAAESVRLLHPRQDPPSPCCAMCGRSSAPKSGLLERERERKESTDFARAYIRVRSAVCTAELDRLESAAKLFRSLVLVVFAMGAVVGLAGNWRIAVVALLLTIAAAWRYCDRQSEYDQRAMAFAAILSHSTLSQAPVVTV